MAVHKNSIGVRSPMPNPNSSKNGFAAIKKPLPQKTEGVLKNSGGYPEGCGPVRI
jgi:hypothetical protein